MRKVILVISFVLFVVVPYTVRADETKDSIQILLDSALDLEFDGYTTEDTATLVGLYRRLAEMGNSYGQYMLGQAYDFGWSVPRDTVAAYIWYLKSAEQKDIDGLRWAGQSKLEGWGTAADTAGGIAMLKESAELGNAYSQYKIGRAYDNSWALPRDTVQAYIWYEKSALQEEKNGLRWAGQCKLEGWGTAVDTVGGMTWLEKAAQLGHIDASAYIGEEYYMGDGYFSQNDSLAVIYLTVAANNGDTVSLRQLSEIYTDTKSPMKNDAMAVPLLEQRIAAGDTGCVTKLGVLYLYSTDILNDYTKAGELFYQAAQTNNFLAEACLANMYYDGLGVTIDDIQAYAWAQRANIHGDTSVAALALESLQEALTPAEMDSAMALTPGWYPLTESTQPAPAGRPKKTGR